MSIQIDSPIVSRAFVVLPIYDTYTTWRLYSSDNSWSGSVVSWTWTPAYSNGSYKLNTWVTATSRAKIYQTFWWGGWSIWINLFDRNPEFQAFCVLSSDTTTNFTSFITFSGNTVSPTQDTSTLVQKHMWFILDGTVLFASSWDGTTQVKTDISSGVTVTALNAYRVTLRNNQILFYVNWILKATHVSNIPTWSIWSASWMQCWIINDTWVTTSRDLYFWGWSISWDA